MTSCKSVVCPYCEKTLKNNYFRRHIINEHHLTDVEWMVLSEQNSTSNRRRFPNVDSETIRSYLKIVYSMNGNLDKTWHSQFTIFYRIVSNCRQITDNDFEQFFKVVLPWQLEHPKICNSKKLCSLCFPNDERMAQKSYHELMEVKNPYYNHGGKFSPFSTNFVGYDKMSYEEKKDAAIKFSRENNDKIVHTTSLQYWINKGYSEEEAKKKLSERQRTFTLEKCIEKYGESKGREIYENRQRQWINTLNERYSGSKKEELNKSKSPKKPKSTGFSYESQALFWEIEAKRQDKTHPAKFALSSDGVNSEFIFNRENGRRFFLDYCIPDIKCVIEYDGSAWHNESTKEYDTMRMNEIVNSGYKVLVISDVEYKKDRIETVSKCLDFISQCEEDCK